MTVVKLTAELRRSVITYLESTSIYSIVNLGEDSSPIGIDRD